MEGFIIPIMDTERRNQTKRNGLRPILHDRSICQNRQARRKNQDHLIPTTPSSGLLKIRQ